MESVVERGLGQYAGKSLASGLNQPSISERRWNTNASCDRPPCALRVLFHPESILPFAICDMIMLRLP
jgi:hypothetical protein